MSIVTTQELLIAESAVALVETRIRERLDACTYCDQGPNAYGQAELAIWKAFKDVRGSFHRIRNEIAKKSGRT